MRSVHRRLRFFAAKHEEVERENALLRAELSLQWEYNHSERCGGILPHAASETCYWPVPRVLSSAYGGRGKSGTSRIRAPSPRMSGSLKLSPQKITSPVAPS